MTMSKTEKAVIRAVIARLRNEANVSPHVDAMLSDRQLRIYLDSWVVGALECLLEPHRDTRLALSLTGYNWKDGKGPHASGSN